MQQRIHQWIFYIETPSAFLVTRRICVLIASTRAFERPCSTVARIPALLGDRLGELDERFEPAAPCPLQPAPEQLDRLSAGSR
jgi:hypothetical protein